MTNNINDPFSFCDERDETRRWLLEIAEELDVEIPDSDSDISIHDSWKKLKNLIIQKIHEERRS